MIETALLVVSLAVSFSSMWMALDTRRVLREWEEKIHNEGM